MSATRSNGAHWDPYDPSYFADPYPAFRRLREEAPLYHNEHRDFYALSRYDDVEQALLDIETYISGRGDILELIQGNAEIPKGNVLWEDPPLHTGHRKLLAGVFTPRRVSALEGKIREICAQTLDPLVGARRFDFIADFARIVPMRVISLVMGIPEADQEWIRDRADEMLRTTPGQPMGVEPTDTYLQTISGEHFSKYIDWRAQNPSDDIMTRLMRTEFRDETGKVRRLTREELLVYVNIVAAAGNETTVKLIGWTGKLLSEHPDQRRELVRNPALIPGAVEEILRYEPPGPSIARYVARDVEVHGRKVPEGSAMLLIIASANRDERRFPDAERFDIHRKISQHLSFGLGVHFCLGAALARLEGRIALEEVLERFPDWEADVASAHLASTSTVRGWETLPVAIP